MLVRVTGNCPNINFRVEVLELLRCGMVEWNAPWDWDKDVFLVKKGGHSTFTRRMIKDDQSC